MDECCVPCGFEDGVDFDAPEMADLTEAGEIVDVRKMAELYDFIEVAEDDLRETVGIGDVETDVADELLSI